VTGATDKPAGWYDDRVTVGVVRWFDGSAWTQHTRAMPTAPVAPTAPVGQVVAPRPAPAASPPPAQPRPPAPVIFAPVHDRPATAPTFSPVPTHAPMQTNPYAAPAQPAPYAAAQPMPYGSYGAPAGGQASAFGGHPGFGGMPTSQPAPYGGQVAPYGGQVAPYGGQVAQYGGQVAPYGGQVGQYGGQVAPYQAFGGPMAPGQYGGYGGYGAPIGGYPDVRKLRNRVIRDLVFGICWLVIGGGIALVRAWAMRAGYGGSGSHLIVTGGLIAGVLAFVRAVRAYRVMVEQGGQRWSPAGRNAAVVGASLALIFSLTGVVQVWQASALPDMGDRVAGSCWTEHADATLWQVRCTEDHEYIATAMVADATGATCPEGSANVLDLADGTGNYLCLTADGALAQTPS